MEETISLKEIFETLKKRIVMIIVITLIAVSAAGVISYNVLTPKYEATTQVLVSQAATGASILSAANPFESDSSYIDTYNVILQSPYILDQVNDAVGMEADPQLTVNQEGESQVVTIRIEDTDPGRAVETANVTAEVFQREIATLLNIDNIHILAPANVSDAEAPVSPNPVLNMAIAFVVGLMASVGLAFLLEFLNNTIRSESDIEKTLGLPVLGAVSIIDDETDTLDEEEINEQPPERRERIGS
ncbi:YveK family protein [Alkalicoccus halolimnae]|uniref:Wzz/FepE/Etk N-terminal domain-containing protein n=1 Tax=Alkalicoccus halolimnae TaxID=1667239 RepID=A0A5C7FI54_9BACI|nr:Wzz/FepE/Etk N-terminal domain-containing protein [Alkalicoccus halolimnae]TXF86997.1 capsular biosynthesis protein [Alkalicoccus halolimnae]